MDCEVKFRARRKLEMKTYRLTTMLVIFILVLSACNMPSSQAAEPTTNPNAVFTAAAQTVVAQLTQNALLVPTNPPAATIAAPTNTTAPAVTNTLPPLPVSTATLAPVVIPTSSCDAAQFISDVSIPDGTVFSANATFVKTWKLKNIGTCTWTSSYTLFYVSGDAMAGPTSQSLTGTIAPGASVDISVNLQAPAADGTYRGYWGIKNPSGQQLNVAGGSSNRSFYVEIKVGSGGGTPSTPGTPGPVGEFAVTGVKFDVNRSGTCSSMTYTVTATITVNKAGEVTYTWIRGDGATGADMSGAWTFDKAGSKSIDFTWTFGGGDQWVELYIDKPNHQQFGRAKLVCP
jgi:hypothetical protein